MKNDALARTTPPLHIVSDLICPWCFVGKQRLKRAFALLEPSMVPEIIWEPYQLNPRMPVNGMNRKEYRSAKFGSWEQSLRMDSDLARTGLPEGTEFRFDLMEKTPNTMRGHQLIHLAQQGGSADAITDALFSAYFEEGLDVGNLDVLLEIGEATGLDQAVTLNALRSDSQRQDVLDREGFWKPKVNHGVPAMFIHGDEISSGAQPPAVLAALIVKSLEEN